MSLSHSRLLANRRNGSKSAGPKSAGGKKRSSRNARRHGLSVPLPAHLNDPMQKELAQLIHAEGIAEDAAFELAQRVIDFERNLSFLRHVFEDDMMGDQGVENIKNFGLRKWQQDLEHRVADIHAKFLKGMPWEWENMVRLTSQMNTLIERTKQKELVSSRRYFKRAANQLIKALRRL